MSLSFRRISLLAALALLAAFAPLARPALAATYTVNSLADSSAVGTLRWAITSANASAGPDTITFSVAGKISLTGPLPALTDQDGVIIHGLNVGNQPTIEISGNGGVGDGIQIFSSNNTVRGLIINGFSGAGIHINGTNATINVIERNYIGTNSTGNAAGFAGTTNNAGAGIRIQGGASTNTIKNNVISGNSGSNGYGIFLNSFLSGGPGVQQGNVIRDNMIGVTVDGSAALPNTRDGVYIGNNANNNIVGPGNIISGNNFASGVSISGRVNSAAPISGNSVIGNKIGTNAAGTAALPNGSGLYIGLSNNTTIGGPGSNSNLISGNTGSGIDIQDDSATGAGMAGVVVQDNWIGVNSSGTVALPNGQSGVRIWKQASGVTIGPNNVISGNQAYGIWLLGRPDFTDLSLQTRNNTIANNIIGAGADATTAVPNRFHGIQIEGATTGNTINGNNRILKNASAGINLDPDDSVPQPLTPTNNTIAGNTISGNQSTGVQVLAGSGTTIGPGNTISGHINGAGVEIQSSQNTVKGNTITGNIDGISITSATGTATDNTIDGNSVTNNVGNGVLVSGLNNIRNKITRTTTNANGGKGIALTGGGNLGDQPNRPGLSGLTVTGNPSTLSGTITNPASCGGSCTVEVFTNDNQLLDEGPIFVISFTATGDFNNIGLPNCKPHLIFTITDAAGNTSEFMSPISVPPTSCVPAAPVVVLSDATPSPSQSALPNTSKTFRHTVSNTGNAAGALTITKSSSNGWPTALDTSACPATLAAGASCVITLTVTVPANALAGEINDTTITAALAGAAATDSKTDRTTALLSPGLAFTPDTQTKSTGPGQPISFTHTLTNTGSGTDIFSVTVTLGANMTGGWSYSVQPAGQISLPPNGSTPVVVTYTSPPAIASPPAYTATVRAFSTNAPATAFKDVTDVITITTAAVPRIASVVTPSSVDSGNPVTLTYTITNVGNISGTFNLSFAQPASWTILTPPPASVSIAQGASTTFDVVVQVPSNAIAGPYSVSLTATGTSAPNASATKTDQITVKQKAALVWSPDLGPFTEPPNQTVTRTLTLTNTGNFTDTVSLAASSSRGWSVQPIPSSVTLNPGANTQVNVRMTIPPGQLAGITDTTYVTATSQLPSVSATARITTTIAAVPGVTLAPPLLQKTIDAGKPMTYTFTLQNSGSITQSYTITRTAVPSGWSSTLAPLTTPTLQPGETVTVTFTLTPPAGTPDGTTASVDITAQCKENPCADGKATAKLIVGPPFAVGVGGPCNGSALPGAIVTCVHTVTNTGFSPDTYVLSALSPLGWITSVSPPSVLLAPGQSRAVTVTLAVPTSADAGLVHVLTFKARSTASPSTSAQLTDTTTVLQVAGVSFSPSRTVPTVGGQEVEFQHTVLNTGNGLDSYVITATQDLNWSITIVPTQTETLPRATYQLIQVKVQVPPGATSVVTNRITLRATSKFAPSVFDQLVDTIGVAGSPTTQYTYVYLPLALR